jgi:hypothetical protein
MLTGALGSQRQRHPSAKEAHRLRTAAELLFEDENRLRRICAIAYVLREKFGNEGALREAGRRMRIAQEDQWLST